MEQLNYVNKDALYPNINAHLHTPYSFSAFESLTQALDMAIAEDVKVVGINDFYTTDGYEEWNKEARARRLYPLFNIELISLQSEDQSAGIRVNDPSNPGRTYLSGKGLRYPSTLPEPYATQLRNVRTEANRQVQQMYTKLNRILTAHQAGFSLDIDRIRRELTKGDIRERHLAKALRLSVYERFSDDPKAIATFFTDIFGNKPLKSSIKDHTSVENEIRGNLLKSGGEAFVPEDSRAFLPFETVRQIILAAGGIPTYPFLGDDARGEFTDFERDIVKAAATLRQRGIHSVEFITPRNSVEVLELYAGYLHDQGFIVTFGSEHNTPAMERLELFTREGTPLTDRLKEINYAGACVIAAHQEHLLRGEEGYLNRVGGQVNRKREEFIQEGNEIIQMTTS